jgi:hypothetical protein
MVNICVLLENQDLSRSMGDRSMVHVSLDFVDLRVIYIFTIFPHCVQNFYGFHSTRTHSTHTHTHHPFRNVSPCGPISSARWEHHDASHVHGRHGARRHRNHRETTPRCPPTSIVQQHLASVLEKLEPFQFQSTPKKCVSQHGKNS